MAELSYLNISGRGYVLLIPCQAPRLESQSKCTCTKADGAPASWKSNLAQIFLRNLHNAPTVLKFGTVCYLIHRTKKTTKTDSQTLSTHAKLSKTGFTQTEL
jgi:hypothetical protein